jgi:hypothetical protein
MKMINTMKESENYRQIKLNKFTDLGNFSGKTAFLVRFES